MNMLQRTTGARKVDPTAKASPLLQVAALCTRQGHKGTQVLLVQSSRGRWILPKGWPMDGRTDAEAAKLEAWEEAGVAKGSVGKAPIARFMTKKRFEDGTTAPCLVTVYPIAVTTMTKTYPEAELRRRRWVSVKKAIKLVSEEGLRDILRAL
ncbi:NUDIX hydrolase [Cognatiyoonia sp. IB215446]|uniref:NUDIX hydrolase n=1 Tax=Cognatiyoonia sp. IB215446 TaxID=3097355 RepID=UPI002A154C79|nr:NUDIX hydrolase [Cognatiyoonia sp. IB215446]MDX8348167.1 NUDIX hydrolase [Cognatiyoonia sp. IB215446]